VEAQDREQIALTADALGEHELRVLIEVGRGLVSELDLELVLERVLEVARALTGARYAALGILDESREELERFIALGFDPETRARLGELPRGRGVLGVLIKEPKPLRLHDVGEHPSSYGFPHGHPTMKSFLGVPVIIRGEAYGNLYLTEKDEGDFTEADEQAVVILAGWAAIAIDNAALYKTVWDRRAELERAVRGLEATTEIARTLGGETDLDRALELIVKRGRALIDARSVMILLCEPNELVVAATAGELGSEIRGLRMPIEGPFANLLASGRPQRLAPATAVLPAARAELGAEPAAALLVPLAFRGRSLGVLAAFDRLVTGPEFHS
jgi:GAF domain-containing protein